MASWGLLEGGNVLVIAVLFIFSVPFSVTYFTYYAEIAWCQIIREYAMHSWLIKQFLLV